MKKRWSSSFEREVGGIANDHGIQGFEGESVYLEDNRVIAKYKNKIKAEEVELQKNIKDIMKKVVKLFIKKFKKENLG